MNRWRGIILLGSLVASLPCRGQGTPTGLRVDVSNFVLYNYDTFDTTQFGMNPKPTNVMMKTYNYHIRIGDITAVGGAPAKGTVLFTVSSSHLALGRKSL